MMREEVRAEIILTYRNMISDRYTFEDVSSKYDIPSSFTEEKLEELKSYFLDHIYPSPAVREEIDEAFKTLQGYTSNPSQLINLLKDSSSLVFTMGWQLPKILKAGLNALGSFKTATDLEDRLIDKVKDSGLHAPYSTEDINGLLSVLPISLIEDFIDDTLKLFKILEDSKLVSRILKVVNTLIDKMKSKPDVYDRTEIRAIELGRNIIHAGDQLFSSLTKYEQKNLFELIAEIERDQIHKIFSTSSGSTDAEEK